jgi:hypothetical protein
MKNIGEKVIWTLLVLWLLLVVVFGVVIRLVAE